MNIYPNSDSNSFCTWLLIQPYIKLTAPQIVVVGEIQTAYAGATFVFENTWNNFMMFSAKWYQYYLAYVAQTTTIWGKLYDFSAGVGFTGFSVNPTISIAVYSKINNLCFIKINMTAGTSNANTFTITGLPFKASNDFGQIFSGRGYNGGAWLTNPAMINTVLNSTTLNLYTSYAGAAWAASLGKMCNMSFVYTTT